MPNENQTLINELTEMRRDMVCVPLTATQLALLTLAAQEAYIQDPEKCWLPEMFWEEFRGAIRTIDALTRTTFLPAVQSQFRDGQQRMDAADKCRSKDE